MGVLSWLAQHWFELLQTLGIIGGLLFTGYTLRKEARAREVSNLIAIKQQHRELWTELYDRPHLFRILKREVDLKAEPITDEEALFVKLLILHLDAVHRAKQVGMFVEIGGLQKDIRDFLALPIPKAIWNRLKPFQERTFITFVESASN